MAILYFAYGSNMDAQQMRDRRVGFSARKRAALPGYSLGFNKIATGAKAKKGEGKGNIVRDSNGTVEGAIYTVTSRLESLDGYEGFPKHYGRKKLEVRLENGKIVKAWVYLARKNMVAEGLKPTQEYLSHYLKGKDLLSPTYLKTLSRVETLD